MQQSLFADEPARVMTTPLPGVMLAVALAGSALVVALLALVLVLFR